MGCLCLCRVMDRLGGDIRRSSSSRVRVQRGPVQVPSGLLGVQTTVITVMMNTTTTGGGGAGHAIIGGSLVSVSASVPLSVSRLASGASSSRAARIAGVRRAVQVQVKMLISTSTGMKTLTRTVVDDDKSKISR